MTYKLGRLAAVRPLGLRDLTCYAGGKLPDAPNTYEAPTYNWGMLGNDQVGDCTLAAVVHLREANEVEDKVNDFYVPSDQAVVDEYFKLTGGQDTGLNEANVLAVWQKVGLFGMKIGGYAPVNHRDQDEIRSVVAAFGGSYLGVLVPAPAQEQFQGGEPWDLTGTDADQQIEGGHAVPVIGYDSDYFYVVTWGQAQKVTPRWLATYLEEAWGVATPEDERVDLAAIQRDLQILTG